MKRLLSVAAAVVALGLGSPSTAATLVIDENGILTGATGVDVLGVSYDVEFVDGTFTSIFGDGSTLSFAGSGQTGVVAAAESLLDQVFIGVFDNDSNLTRGCSFNLYCIATIPYEVQEGEYLALAALNNNQFGFEDFYGSDRGDVNFDTSLNPSLVFARFTLSGSTPPPVNGAVPEPTTWAMMLFGFFGIGGTLRFVRGRQKLSVSYS